MNEGAPRRKEEEQEEEAERLPEPAQLIWYKYSRNKMEEKKRKKERKHRRRRAVVSVRHCHHLELGVVVLKRGKDKKRNFDWKPGKCVSEREGNGQPKGNNWGALLRRRGPGPI